MNHWVFTEKIICRYADRILSKNFGGGGLLSGGSYCTALASSVFNAQKPKHIVATGFLNKHGNFFDILKLSWQNQTSLYSFTYLSYQKIEIFSYTLI